MIHVYSYSVFCILVWSFRCTTQVEFQSPTQVFGSSGARLSDPTGSTSFLLAIETPLFSIIADSPDTRVPLLHAARYEADGGWTQSHISWKVFWTVVVGRSTFRRPGTMPGPARACRQERRAGSPPPSDGKRMSMNFRKR
jgi:hypothetical protein